MQSTQFMTAREKETVLKQWRRFILSGCWLENFTQALYNHLIQHCSFIAHYSRIGFYGTYFDDEQSALKFLSQFESATNHMSVEYGTNHWFHQNDYVDINTAMCNEFEDNKKFVLSQLKKRFERRCN